MQVPKVSIIITVYNLETVLNNCLVTCVNQSCRDIEILVINDGSTDSSNRIIEDFKAIDKRIIVVNKTNEGICFARKVGIEIAKGEYIFFLDGDDTIPLNTIETLYNLSQLYSADLVAGNFSLISDGSLIQERIYSNFGVGSGIKFLEFILFNHLHYLCGKLIKRSLYILNEFIFTKKVLIGEDQLQMFQLCMFADKVATTDAVIYNYIFNNSSISRKGVPTETFTAQQELYAHALYKLQQKFSYNNLIRQQINLRILMALNLALHYSGRFVVNKSQSSLVMSKTLINSLFEKGSYLFRNGASPIIIRSELPSLPPNSGLYKRFIYRVLRSLKFKDLMFWLHKMTLRRKLNKAGTLVKSLINIAFPGLTYKLRSKN